MILLGLINRCADKRQRELFSCLDVVRAAADLEGSLLPCVDRRQVEVRTLDWLAGLNQADHNARYILPDLIKLLHLKPAGEQLLLELLGRHIDLYIFFQPAKWCKHNSDSPSIIPSLILRLVCCSYWNPTYVQLSSIWLSTLMSDSNSCLILLMPYFSMAVRSMPIPNARPE